MTTVPLGSQLAAGLFFPDRKKLETGHRLNLKVWLNVFNDLNVLRIPLHLFPIETQNKILEVEETPEEEEEEENTGGKYVDASSFRHSAPTHRRLTPEELSIR